MPSEPERRTTRRRTLVVAVVAAAVGAGTAVAATAQLGPRTGPERGPRVVTADLTGVEPFACPAARRSPSRPDAVLNRVFHVEDEAGSRYLVGWTLLPYTGPGTYELGGDARSLLAVQPANGGTPLGYGTGTVAMDSDDAGTIDARVELRAGGELALSGSWSCMTGS